MSHASSAPFKSRYQPLTLCNLKTLSQDTRPDVLGFVREQQENARYYANAAARSEFKTTDETRPQILNKEPPSTAFMKGSSPPLVARVDRRKRNMQAALDTERRQEHDKTQQLAYNRDEILYGEFVKKVQRSSRRKRAPRSDEEEYSARLQERRERKRAKRSIIAPMHNDDNSHSSDQTQRKSACNPLGNKRNGKRLRAVPGVALMETFTATNVKASRLTLKPNSGGLFKRVKSSVGVAPGGKENRSNTKNGHGAPSANGRENGKRVSKSKSCRRKTASPKRHKSPSSPASSSSRSEASSESILSQVPIGSRVLAPSHHSTNLRSNLAPRNIGSESWGIHSELPSEDSSIRLFNKDISANEECELFVVQDPPSLSRAEESTILKMPTNWHLNGDKTGSGTFRRFPSDALDTPAGNENRSGQKQCPTNHRPSSFCLPSTQTRLSCASQNSSLPVNNHNSLALEVHARAADEPDEELTDAHCKTWRKEPVLRLGIQTDGRCNSPLAQRSSPANSLDHLLAVHDREEAFYHLDYATPANISLPSLEGDSVKNDNRHPILEEGVEGLGAIPFYAPTGEAYDAGDPVNGTDVEGVLNPDLCEIPPEDAAFMPYVTEAFDEELCGEARYGEELYDTVENTREGTYEQAEQAEEYGDTYSPASGRGLLVGSASEHESAHIFARELGDQPRLAYGQSVEEIEKAFGGQIAFHW